MRNEVVIGDTSDIPVTSDGGEILIIGGAWSSWWLSRLMSRAMRVGVDQGLDVVRLLSIVVVRGYGIGLHERRSGSRYPGPSLGFRHMAIDDMTGDVRSCRSSSGVQ